MNFYFVYSGGGGAGDWGGVNRVWNNAMPNYFKDHLLIKFGDIYFNHKGSKDLLRKEQWLNTNSSQQWLTDKIGAPILTTPNLILDVGTTKIVNYIDSHFPNLSKIEIIEKFDQMLFDKQILDKYCDFVLNSNIRNAVTFDIPNPFKIRNQSGNPIRNIFNDANCKSALVEKCIKYANYTHKIIQNQSRLLTILPGFLQGKEITNYLNALDYKPTKLAIGALIDIKSTNDFENTLKSIDKVLNLSSYEKVHFLGCGGLKKASSIKKTLGNHPQFSVDNTTAFNRVIDGSKNGNKSSKNDQSCYIDYIDKKQHRIKPGSKDKILELHKNTPNAIKLFSNDEMTDIVDSIIEHQSNRSSRETYENRAKLIIHNFDVFKFNAS